MLHADPTGHPGRIGSLAPYQEIRFGNLEFSVDSRGDLSFVGLAIPSDEAEDSEALTSDLPLDSVLGSILADDSALSPDPVTVPKGQGSAPAEHTFCTDTLEVNSESPR